MPAHLSQATIARVTMLFRLCRHPCTFIATCMPVSGVIFRCVVTGGVGRIDRLTDADRQDGEKITVRLPCSLHEHHRPAVIRRAVRVRALSC